MINLRNVLVLFGIVGALGTGCVIDVASRSAYDSCGAGDTCGGGTACQASLLVASGGVQGSLCTVPCSAGSSCSNGGFTGFCVFSLSQNRGQCYRPCTSTFDCGSGMVCGDTGTGAQVCVPNTSGVPATCGASGQTCCAGSTCNSGLACGTGNVCGTPCGLTGQTCCPGNACTGNLACGMNGRCAQRAATAYTSCTPAGSACTDGTTCITALARGPSTPAGNTCTSICSSGSASMCPSYQPGRVECVNLTGNPSMFQCVRLCTTAADCAPYNTQCLSVQSAGGAMINICAP